MRSDVSILKASLAAASLRTVRAFFYVPQIICNIEGLSDGTSGFTSYPRDEAKWVNTDKILYLSVEVEIKSMQR